MTAPIFMSAKLFRRLLVVLTLCLGATLLIACEEEERAGDIAAGTFDPGLADRQRGLCEAEGGRWGVGGSANRFVCYTTTKDANQQCSTSGDCEGHCLARSRTCAPFTPFFGCHEVLDSGGARQTLCLE
jgi:hypothetical protein